jgi:rhamnosyltransferase
MILNESSKRLLIYFFYDQDGIVDRYVSCVLNDMKKNVTDILFVSNGKLEEKSYDAVAKIADEILERENVGFDVWAYKDALEHIGFDQLAEKYDEVVLMNYTIMGPIYPFSEMFDTMDAQDLDFWGLTKNHKVPCDPCGTLERGYIREHLQSHFIAVRRSVLKSDAFKTYWAEMPMICSYVDSVSYHETKFTHHFAELGYKWRPYVETTDLESYTYCPILFAPIKLLKEKRCPVIKRRSFFHDYTGTLSTTAGECGYELMRYLKENTSYDIDMIWENILRCYPMADIKNSLQLNYILPAEQKKEKRSSSSIALVFHAYFLDLLESTSQYVNAMPEQADIYITTDTVNKKEQIEKHFSTHKFHKLEVRLIENRGRDVSALLVGVKDVVMNYDYVCFAHDKKVTQIATGSVGAGFAYQCLEGVLSSEAYVDNVVALFDENPRLGLVTPPPPFHANYFITVGDAWGPNFDGTKELADRLGLNVPFKKESYPISPLGTMFWFRTKGMQKLFDCDWEYTDFPKEPNKSDGTLLHAIERIYNLVEQDAGYYSAYCVPSHLGSILMTNYNYMLSGLVEAAQKSGFETGFYHDYVQYLEKFLSASDKYGVSYSALAHAYRGSMRLYYAERGQNFDENNSVVGVSKEKPADLDLTFFLPHKTNKIESLRFDPEELGGVKIRDLFVEYICKNGTHKILTAQYMTTNGKIMNGNILFSHKAPEIMWTLPEPEEIVCVKITGKIHRNMASDATVQADLRCLDTVKLYYGQEFSFNEANVLTEQELMTSKEYHFSFSIPRDVLSVGCIRFDPGEKGGICIKKISAYWVDHKNKRHIFGKPYVTNGFKHKGVRIFMASDPWIAWTLPKKKAVKAVLIDAEISYANDVSPFAVEKANIWSRFWRKVKKIIRR